MQTKTLVVGAGIVRRNEFYLIAQRDGSNRFIPYLWEFPGGKLELGETLAQCVQREILEEIGINIEVGELFEQVVYNYAPDFQVELNVYSCQWLEGIAQPLHCQAVCWITLDQFSEYSFAPADLPVVHKLTAHT